MFVKEGIEGDKKHWILIGHVHMLVNKVSRDIAPLFSCVIGQPTTNLRTVAELDLWPKWMKPLSDYLENTLLGERKQSCGQAQI